MSDLNWCTFCDNAISPFSVSLLSYNTHIHTYICRLNSSYRNHCIVVIIVLEPMHFVITLCWVILIQNAFTLLAAVLIFTMHRQNPEIPAVNSLLYQPTIDISLLSAYVFLHLYQISVLLIIAKPSVKVQQRN
jgi:hypothetical protein